MTTMTPRRVGVVTAVLGCLALLASLLVTVVLDDRAAAGGGTGRFLWVESVDRGDTFRLVLADGAGGIERVLAPHVYGRPALSPDGRRVAFSAPLSDGSDGRWGLHVVGVDGSGLTRLTAPAVGDFDPAWSPDGTRIAVSRDERGNFEPSCCTLHVVPLDASAALRLGGATHAKQPAWSPNGTEIAFTAPDGIRVVGAVDGPPRVVAQGALSWPAWSPDGSRLAAVRRQGPESGTIAVLPAGGGGGVDTAAGSGGGLPEAPVWADDRTLLHLNAWGQGENGRNRSQVRETTVDGGSTTLFTTPRPAFSLTWDGWSRPPAQARSFDQACPPDRTPPAGFGDVPTGGVHSRAIDCVVFRQIAQGREPGRYAPTLPVSRQQMATFIAGLVVRSGGTLPEPTRDHFPDDNGSVHEASINRLAEAGVVQGRSGGRYEPLADVSRAQMAAFLVRGYDLRAAQAGQSRLAATEDWFYDDGAQLLHDDINKAASAGLTGGTGAGRYSPAGAVRRDQMASFVSRTLDLLVSQGMGTPPP